MIKFDSRSFVSVELTCTTMYYNSEWNKIVLLLWKNVRILFNVWKSLAFTALCPLLFCVVLIVLRIAKRGIIDTPEITHKAVNLSEYWTNLNGIIDERKLLMDKKIAGFSYSPFVPQKVIGYAPDAKPFNLIMETSKPYLQPMTLKKFFNCKMLEKAVLKQSLFCGVCFITWRDYFHYGLGQDESKTYLVDIYPRFMLLELVLPNVLRIYNDTYISSTWNTHTLHPTNFQHLPRNLYSEDGGFVGYIREGFAHVQSVVTKSYLKRISVAANKELEIPELVVQRFPEVARTRDNFIEVVDFTFSFMIVLSHYYPVLYLIAHIVHDKHDKRKIFTKVFEVHNYLHHFSWITKAYWVHMFITITMAMLFKMRWINDLAIFNKTRFEYLLLVMGVYNLASVSFSLMMSSIFTYTITAVIASAFIWFISYIPYFSKVSLYDEGLFAIDYLCVVLFHNTVLGHLFDGIMIYELYATKTTLTDFLSVVNLDNPLTIGKCLLVMLGQAVGYLVIGLSVEEGAAIYEKLWNYFRNRKLISDVENSIRHSLKMNIHAKQESFVHEILGRSTTIVNIKNINKAFEDEIVIKNFSIELYENQITILIGHNGCGKSTLLRMICGLVEPTTGTITMDGFNLKKERKFACASLGICLEDDALYPDLTVEDQLRFFSYLKGLDLESIERDVNKYLSASNLIDKRKTLTEDLSVGARSELAICCALTGHSRVVLLDEPFAAMDDARRSRSWELLLKEKQGRTILIAANCIDILNVLGDRIAIMSNGELQCVGTPSFLKKMYGQGYRLTCIKKPECDSQLVNELMQRYISHITPTTDVGYAITYHLSEKYAVLFDEIVNDLQNNLDKLSLLKVSIRPLCLKDIFMKMGTSTPAFGNYTQLTSVLRGESPYKTDNQYLEFIEIKERITGWKRLKQQIAALIIIKYKFLIFYKFNMLTKIFTLPAFIATAFFSSAYYINYTTLPKMKFSIDSYSRSITIMENKSADNKIAALYSNSYGSSIYWHGYQHTLIYIAKQTFNEFILSISKYEMIENDYVVGVTYLPNMLKCWFNNYYLHSVPLAINMAYQSVQRAILGEHAVITMYIKPVPVVDVQGNAQEVNATGFPVTFSMFLAMGTSFLSSSVVYGIIRSKNCGFLDLEKLTGLKRKIYWLVTMYTDVLYLSFLAFSFIITLAVFSFSKHIALQSIGWYTIAYIIIGLSIYSFNYMLSLFIKHPINGYVISTAIAAFGMVCFMHCYQGLQDDYMSSPKMKSSNYFLLLPHFVLSNAICTIYYNMEYKRMCENRYIFEVTVYLEDCKSSPNCCYDYNILNINDGIVMELIASVINIAFCWSIIIIKEQNYINLFLKPPKDNNDAALCDHMRRHQSEDDEYYQSIFLESLKLQRTVGCDKSFYTLICDRVGKFYENSIAVDRFSLQLQKGSILGLIGSNHSGKSTLLKMIAGLTTASYGRMYISGYNTINHPIKTMRLVGYGPQYPITFYEITIKDIMKYLCTLHCYPYQKIDAICTNLAKVIGLYPFYNKRLGTLSTGTSKMLLCALALLDNRPLLLLDSLTVDMDASAHLRIWNILNRMKNNGTSIIHTSTYLSILEKFTDRISMITCGCCQILASPREIDTAYPNHNLIRIKLNSSIIESQNDSTNHYLYQSSVNKLCKFIEFEFPQSVPVARVGHFIEFLISIDEISSLGLLKKISANQYYLNIEDFEILRNTFYGIIEKFMVHETECNRI